MRETALITGASSGIGEELARLFAADGADLVLVARRADRLEALADELRRAHDITAYVLPKDLARPEAPGEVFDETERQGINVDVLVNNAGVGAREHFAAIDTGRQVDMVQVNVTALTHLARLYLPGMLERGRGAILNVGSAAGFQPVPGFAVYAATKAYVLSFTEGLAEELRGSGISATLLAPGATATEFARAAGVEGTLSFRRGAMDARTVAKAGYEGMRAGRVIVVPRLRNRLSSLAVRLLPRSLVRRAAGRAMSAR